MASVAEAEHEMCPVQMPFSQPGGQRGPRQVFPRQARAFLSWGAGRKADETMAETEIADVCPVLAKSA